MQILNAVPNSLDQTWHSDNRSRGLSIIVPLADFDAENGATQLLLGSHVCDWARVAREGCRAFAEQPVAQRGPHLLTYFRLFADAAPSVRAAACVAFGALEPQERAQAVPDPLEPCLNDLAEVRRHRTRSKKSAGGRRNARN